MAKRIIVVNDQDRVLGFKERNAITREDTYRVSALWATNSKGEILLARRARTKSHDPGKWGPAVAGTVEEGETYESNIVKEAKEELGLKGIEFKKGPKTRKHGEHEYFCQWFTTTIDKPLKQFKIRKEEVEEIQWFPNKELNQQMKEKPIEFLESLNEWVKMFEKSAVLEKKKRLVFFPKAPFHFDATLHKPSHFPSSDNDWEKGKYWISMRWRGEKLGLKLENQGSVSKPKVRITIYSKKRLGDDFVESARKELAWRFNLESDLSEFSKKFRKEKVLAPILQKWKGMRPAACHSLYETLVIYIVLQNATVGRSVQMLENLFNRLGTKVSFDGKALNCFWEPSEMAKVSEQELRELKVGYRAKFLKRLTEQFAKKEIDEFALRNQSSEAIREAILQLYGIGPASVEYLLFEGFYRYDAFTTIPPWEQKILSMLLFQKKLVPTAKILEFADRWGAYKKLAIHYIWEDVFWKRKNERIPWLEKEIRL